MRQDKWYEIHVEVLEDGLTAAEVQALVQELAARLDGSNGVKVKNHAQYRRRAQRSTSPGDPEPHDPAHGVTPLYICHNKM